MLKDSFEFAQADAQSRSLYEARVEAGRVVEALGNALDADGEKLLAADEISVLQEGMLKLKSLTAGDDTKAINTGVEMLGKASDEFAGLRMDASVRRALAGYKIDELAEGLD